MTFGGCTGLGGGGGMVIDPQGLALTPGGGALTLSGTGGGAETPGGGAETPGGGAPEPPCWSTGAGCSSTGGDALDPWKVCPVGEAFFTPTTDLGPSLGTGVGQPGTLTLGGGALTGLASTTGGGT